MTINEIAGRAGVSRATVSRVINGFPGIREETRSRVEAVIREAGYIPSAAARSLASRKSGIIGGLIYNITEPFWDSVISGVERGVEDTGYALFYVNSKRQNEAWDYAGEYKKNLRLLIERGVDGIVIALLGDLDGEDVDLLERTGTPFVVIQNYLADPRVASVNVDNAAGAQVAFRHLYSLGHRAIVHVTGPLDSGIARDRLQGFLVAAEEAGTPSPGSRVVSGGFGFRDGYWAMQQILAEGQRPTAVIMPSDMAAFGACHCAREQGVAIPGDISVVGFDHIAEHIDYAGLLPDLTTIQQPVTEIGLAAAELLIAMMGAKPPERRQVEFSATLYEGATCKKLC